MEDMGEDGHEVGTFAEEAGKLFGAVAGWAREHAGEPGDGLSTLFEQVSASTQNLDSHIATGSASCAVCPVCRAIHVVRQLSPEVREHLVSAAASMAQAAAALMTAPTPGDETPTADA